MNLLIITVNGNFMKKIGLLLLVTFYVMGCDDKEDNIHTDPPPSNIVLVLKIDFETNVFEAGTEIIFNTDNEFGISSEYVSPADFGSVELRHQETSEKIFSGSIVWNGSGEVEYPEVFTDANKFDKIDTSIEMPDVNLFQKVMYHEFAYYPDTIEYQEIWNSIHDLALVKRYRDENGAGKIHLLLYTPSVGILDTAKADWIVILNR